MGPAQLVGQTPVSRGGAPVEEAGLGEDERAGADRGDPLARVERLPKRVQCGLIGVVAASAGRDDHGVRLAEGFQAARDHDVEGVAEGGGHSGPGGADLDRVPGRAVDERGAEQREGHRQVEGLHGRYCEDDDAVHDQILGKYDVQVTSLAAPAGAELGLRTGPPRIINSCNMFGAASWLITSS
jgi:hypothetical protein